MLREVRAGLVALSACPKGEIATDLLDGNEAGAVRDRDDLTATCSGAENYFPRDPEPRARDRGSRSARARRELSRADRHAAGRHQRLPLPAPRGRRRARRAALHPDRQERWTTRTACATRPIRCYFKSADEMKAALRATIPQALAQHARDRRALQPPARLRQAAAAGVPAAARSGRAPSDYLRDLAWRGAARRASRTGADAMRERFEYELGRDLPHGLRVVLPDRARLHRTSRASRGIGVGPGRGSVAGSLVAYALRITDIDPLRPRAASSSAS